ncbi:MAG: hypothetical protein GTN46_06420, partial [Gammaproteobacteria bacterium]|nr:hypothetical protein [Gammaproteobacteria bacterium]
HFGDLLGIQGLRETSFTLTVSRKVKSQYVEARIYEAVTYIAQDSGMSGAGETVTQDDATVGIL